VINKAAKTAAFSNQRLFMKVTCTWKFDGIVSLNALMP
jgi:hypothetical protein